VFAVAAVVIAVALPGLSSPRRAAAEVDKAAETFDAVWTIVRDSHFDPSFDRAAWDRVSQELRPKAIAATTPGELRDVLRDMLGRLGLSHFAVIPGSPDTPTDRDLSAEPGFDARVIDRQLVVSSVEPDGGAAAAGVHTGWIVQAIDGTPVSGFLDAVLDTAPPRMAQLESWRALVTRIRGPYDSHVDVTFVDGTGATVTRSIMRKGERGEPVKVGSLPTMYVRVSSSSRETAHGRLAGIIGFNVWMTAVDRAFQQAVDRYRSADGIVIDLRGNPGGLAAMVMGIAGHFTATRDTLGVMTMKDRSELHFNANPRLVNAAGQRVEPFKGSVAILVDGMTGSASECFAGGMQSLGRARIFGQTSMGQALPALFDKLPNGDVLIHAWGDFVTGTGVRIEGRGVVPDVPVTLTRAALLDGRDTTLEAALAWIDAQAAPSK
jgi:carboxyl-terminal processing protease